MSEKPEGLVPFVLVFEMGANQYGRPIEPITRDDHSGYVVLTIYASFFVTLVFWMSRIGIRWRRQRLKMDDIFLIAAMVGIQAEFSSNTR